MNEKWKIEKKLGKTLYDRKDIETRMVNIHPQQSACIYSKSRMERSFEINVNCSNSCVPLMILVSGLKEQIQQL